MKTLNLMFDTRNNFIITGCNGLLGGELCRRLHDIGEPVIGIARANRNVDWLVNRGISCFTYEYLPEIVKKGDVFIHCAAKVGNNGTWEEFVEVNKNLTVSLFNQSSLKGIGCFIYISSVAVLGYKNRFNNTVLIESDNNELTEGEYYGRSKWETEQVLLQEGKKSAIRVVILRPGLIYGHRPNPVKTQTWLKNGIAFDPNQRIPLVNIKSLTDAIILTAKRSEASGPYFVVDDEQPLLRDLNDLKYKLGLIKYKPRYIGKIGFIAFYFLSLVVKWIRCTDLQMFKGKLKMQYYFQTRRIRYCTDKLRSETGWVPVNNLEKELMDEAKKQPT